MVVVAALVPVHSERRPEAWAVAHLAYSSVVSVGADVVVLGIGRPEEIVAVAGQDAGRRAFQVGGRHSDCACTRTRLKRWVHVLPDGGPSLIRDGVYSGSGFVKQVESPSGAEEYVGGGDTVHCH